MINIMVIIMIMMASRVPHNHLNYQDLHDHHDDQHHGHHHDDHDDNNQMATSGGSVSASSGAGGQGSRQGAVEGTLGKVVIGMKTITITTAIKTTKTPTILMP